MNAPNPNAGERDLEALRRAQRAHEPSMEEILASIRSIIADDREPAAPKPAAKPSPAAAGPQIVYSKDAPPPRPVSETPARLEPAPPPPEPAAPKVVWRQPESEPVAVAPVVRPEPAAGEEPLISLQTNQAVSAAFEALSASLALQSAELAENVTREILRPMLKAWLDEHLPSLVERLVRAEIQRVARGGR
ncbi:MAG: DUF2497 domain-containing protein [Roseiarcus sp.]|jgi:cell pole-organizing protein PopZ